MLPETAWEEVVPLGRWLLRVRLLLHLPFVYPPDLFHLWRNKAERLLDGVLARLRSPLDRWDLNRCAEGKEDRTRCILEILHDVKCSDVLVRQVRQKVRGGLFDKDSVAFLEVASVEEDVVDVVVLCR